MKAAEDDSVVSRELLDRIAQGDALALEQLLARDREFIRQIIALRFDTTLTVRLDISDLIQETQLQIAQRIQDYLTRRPMPYRMWLRKTAVETAIQTRRRHRAACRDVNREVVLPFESSLLITRQIIDPAQTPLQQLLITEKQELMHQAVAQLNETDQEILLMRAVEGLSNHEVAQILQIDPATSSKRFGRAVLNLQQKMRDLSELSAQE